MPQSSNASPSTNEPRLAPPGAGLPWPELQIARLLFRIRRLRGERSTFDAEFRAEQAAIVALVERGPQAFNAVRVLIPRLRGLEDSSRYWSVWMTVDHLRIVNDEVAAVLGQLLADRTPRGAASTAAVKPSPTADESVMAGFQQSCERLLATVAAAPSLQTRARFSHPWFGSLDAAGWHALVSMHMRIHRRQIEVIRSGRAAGV